MRVPVTAQSTKEPGRVTRYSPSRYSSSARPSGLKSRSIWFMALVYSVSPSEQRALIAAGPGRTNGFRAARLRFAVGHGGAAAGGEGEHQCFAGSDLLAAPSDAAVLAAHQREAALEHRAVADPLQHPRQALDPFAHLPEPRRPPPDPQSD